MSLNYRQQSQLHRIGAGLRHSDPHLGAMLEMFGQLYPDQSLPAWEQAPQASSGQDRLHRAGARLIAALIAAAAAITAQVTTVGPAITGWGVEDYSAEPDGDGVQERRHQGHAGDPLRRPDGCA